jgi:long-subunit fatty acid transport protein
MKGAWLACAVVAASGTSAALASPLADPFLGGVVFTGATHPHASSFFYNPAALGLDAGNHVYAAGNAVFDRYSVERAAIDAAGSPTSGQGAAVEAGVFSPAGFLAVYFNGTPVSGGVAIYTPYVDRQLAEQPDLRYHTLGGYTTNVAIEPAVSFRVGSQLLIGFGVSLAPYSPVKFSFARDTALEGGSMGLASDCGGAPCGAENPLASQRYDVDVNSRLNFGFNLGVVVRLPREWYLGVGYVSPMSSFPRLLVEAAGTVTVTPAPRDGGPTRHGRARLIYKLPQSVHLGLRGQLISDFYFVVGGHWISTSRQDVYDLRMFGGDLAGADIPEWYPRYRGLRDLVAVEVGIEGKERMRFRPGARLRLESAATPDQAVAPHQIAGPNVSLATGLEVRLSREFAITAGYALAWYPRRHADPSAFDPADRIACVDQRFPLDVCTAAVDGRASPTAAGEYGRLQHVLSTALRVDWF